MAARTPPEDNSRPHEELGPELRQAVEAVLHDDPSADWTEQTLDKLRQRSPQPAPRKTRRVVMWIALVAAASILAVAIVKSSWTNSDGPEIAGPAPAPPQEQTAAEPRDVVEPTLWEYRLAARQSPEALDELLDRHAGQLLYPSSDTSLAGTLQESL